MAGHGQAAEFCAKANKLRASIKQAEFFYYLRNYYPLKNDSAFFS
jgi:hypothetical protein